MLRFMISLGVFASHAIPLISKSHIHRLKDCPEYL